MSGCNGRQIDRVLTTPLMSWEVGRRGISRALALLANAMTHALINVEWNTLLYTLLSLACVGVFQSLPSWSTIFISLHNFVIKILAQFSLSTLPKCNKRQRGGGSRCGPHRYAHGELLFVEYRNLFACLFIETQPGRRQGADALQIYSWKILKTVELRAHFSPTLSLSLALSLHFNNSVLLLAAATTTCELGATT